ncbi:MAG: hypothetical protein AB1638_00540 [Nitrospirota bacterium]
MRSYKTKKLISILMGSPFYMTLTTEERHSLIARLVQNYPFLIQDKDDEIDKFDGDFPKLDGIY